MVEVVAIVEVSSQIAKLGRMIVSVFAQLMLALVDVM